MADIKSVSGLSSRPSKSQSCIKIKIKLMIDMSAYINTPKLQHITEYYYVYELCYKVFTAYKILTS